MPNDPQPSYPVKPVVIKQVRRLKKLPDARSTAKRRPMAQVSLPKGVTSLAEMQKLSKEAAQHLKVNLAALKEGKGERLMCMRLAARSRFYDHLRGVMKRRQRVMATMEKLRRQRVKEAGRKKDRQVRRIDGLLEREQRKLSELGSKHLVGKSLRRQHKKHDSLLVFLVDLPFAVEPGWKKRLQKFIARLERYREKPQFPVEHVALGVLLNNATELLKLVEAGKLAKAQEVADGLWGLAAPGESIKR